MRDIDYYQRATTRVGIYTEKVGGRKLDSGSATGFWYRSKSAQLYLVTNRHVVLDEESDHYPDFLTADARCHSTGVVKPLTIALYAEDLETRQWHQFPERRTEGIPERDIAALPVQKPLDMPEGEVAAFDEQSFVPDNVLVEAGDDLRVLGCPLGLYDSVNNLPIVRNAIAASAPRIKYLGMDCFIVDAHLHEGISGSPVLTRPGQIGKQEVVGKERFDLVIGHNDAYLLGIVSADQRAGAGLGIVWRARLLQDLVE